MIYIRCGNGNTENYDVKYAEKIQNILDKPQENDEISERNMKMWEEIFKTESEDKE